MMLLNAVADDSAVTNAAGCAVVCMELETWVTKKIMHEYLARWPKKKTTRPRPRFSSRFENATSEAVHAVVN